MIRRVVLAVALLLATAPVVGAHAADPCGPWMRRGMSPDARADALVRVMTLDQKVGLLHQSSAEIAGSWGSAGYVPGIPALCVPPLQLNDGPSGIGNAQVGTTVFPAEISMAASWDPLLQERVGRTLAQQARAKGVDVFLAPDVNLARTPLNGRTSEGFGEDPYLASRAAVAYVDGVQSQHVIATVKHLDANNQELDRMTVDARVDERTLMELYGAPFAAAVGEAHAGSVMCAYNTLNGAPSCQNGPLLRRELDTWMRFPGYVVSDWNATHSTVPSALNGLDLEMGGVQRPDAVASTPLPASENYYGAPLADAVRSGRVPLRMLDEMVHRVLRSMFAVGLFDHPFPAPPTGYPTFVDTDAARAVSRQAAEAGTVLLRNQHAALPVTGTGVRIAVIGADAGAGAVGVSQAGGSAHVGTSSRLVTPLQGITRRALEAGDSLTYTDGSSLQAAAAQAAASDVAIVVAGYVETEDGDRTGLDADNGYCVNQCYADPGTIAPLVRAVAAANPRTVVVLQTGGPALMPWLRSTAAVVEAWYGGQEEGDALAAVLFGDVDPSGRLPVTFPASLAQLPTRTPLQYPGVGGREEYSERLLIGYRWYDAQHLVPLFPFGFGLSYTRFALSALAVRPRADGAVAVSCTVRNTGRRTGSDVVQVYVSYPPAAGEPPRQLRGFARVALGVGASRRVTVTLPRSAFEVWDPAVHEWRTPPGTYTVRVGESAASLPLWATLRR